MEKEMIKLDELIKQEIKNNFTNNLMETLNSAFIFKYVQTLETQLKKQKEVIDKAIEELKKGLHELDIRRREEVYIEEYIENALDILKEVSE